MISDSATICKKIAEKENMDYQLIKDINDFVFSTVKEKMISGSKLITSLKGFGSWYYRKAKSIEKLSTFVALTEKELELEQRLKNIIEQYKVFNNDKLQKKHEKYGKENYEAYVLALKQKQIQESKKDKPR